MIMVLLVETLPPQVFACKFCEIFNKIFFILHLRVAASSYGIVMFFFQRNSLSRFHEDISGYW